jgi:hypothetical protein
MVRWPRRRVCEISTVALAYVVPAGLARQKRSVVARDGWPDGDAGRAARGRRRIDARGGASHRRGRFSPRDRAPGDQGFRGVCELPDVSTSPMADRRASIELGEVDESAIGDIGLADVDDVSVRDPPRRQPLCCRGRSSVREPSGDAVLCVEGLGCTQARADHLGMGFSVLGVSYLSYNRPLVIATLNDWGWCSKGNPPPWYTGEPGPSSYV